MILRHNHRQGDQSDFADMLNRFRLGIVTEDDLKKLQDRQTTEKHLDEDAMHISYTNEEVEDHNKKMMNTKKTELVSVEALKRFPRGAKPKVRKDGRINNCNLLDVLQVKNHLRCVMTYNVNTIDGLVNGQSGTIVGLEFKNEMLDCIIVQFDKETVGELQRNKYPGLAAKYKKVNGTPIFRQELDVQLGKHGTGASGKVLQLPLRIFYASTCHKMQVSS